jgi:class 3 adenylate cyclase/tetratricopeptide (TPR) repeat protein
MAVTQQVTVVFTDLVGSTEMSSRLNPEHSDQLRETHFALLRRAIEDNGGTEVKNLGDGLMVVFSITSGALNGAEAMQQSVARFNERAPEPLFVRIGLSHGEVTEDDGDYFGDAVVEAARLCSRAEGSQILATQLVQLTAGRRAKQEFISLGEFELKGLPDPVATVEVRWTPMETVEGDGLVPLPTRCAPTTTAGFVGRASQRTLLDDVFKRVSTEGRHQLVLIGGEPGMGKTTLATECARAAHENGAIVLFGRCNEDLSVPYGMWAEALTHLVAHAQGSLHEVLAPLGESLASLAPALATTFGVSGEPTVRDPEAARYMLLCAVADALRVAGEIAPVVLVLDDLQWADAPSLLLLRHVAASEPIRLLVIGTFRESDVASGHPLADLLGALHREHGTERIALRGFDDLELLSMMEGVGGQSLGEDGLALRDALIAETDGNPFFVGELLRHLVESGGIFQVDGRWVASPDLREKGLPVSVREVIGRRVSQMGDTGSRALCVASVIGRDFELSLLAAASEMDEDTLLDILDRATEATLVDNVEGTRYTFVHALIEHTLYDSLAPARRARLHRRVAEAIEAQTRGRTEGRSSELAYHWTQAAVPEDLDKAVGYAQAAGDESMERLAPAEALRWYDQALSLRDQRPSAGDEDRCRLLVALGNAQRQCGIPAHRETLLDAAHLAQQCGATDLLVAAALANSRGFFSASGVVDAELVALIEAASEACRGTGSTEEARLLAQLVSELTFNGDYPRRKELADVSLAIARSTGDPGTLARVITGVFYSINIPETLEECLGLITEGFDIARTVGDPVLQMLCATFTEIALYQSGDVIAADAILLEGKHIAERLGQPSLDWLVSVQESGRALLAGDLDEAEHKATLALEFGTASGQPDALAVFGAQMAHIRLRQGRTEELLDLLEQMVRDNPGIPGFVPALAAFYCDCDRFDDARSILEPFVADGFDSMPKDVIWLISVCLAGWTVSEVGWSEAALPIYQLLLPFVDQIPHLGNVNAPEVSYFLGSLATTLGLDDEAETYFSQSATTHERIGAAWSLAETQLVWGRFLARRGGSTDLERATTLLEKALDTAQQRGYGLVERRARRALEALGHY